MSWLKFDMKIQWYEKAWEEYCSWQTTDKKILKKINELIKEIQRNPFEGTGKPEALKGNLSGWWSRRIDAANRIVYKQIDDFVAIAACKGHYESL